MDADNKKHHHHQNSQVTKTGTNDARDAMAEKGRLCADASRIMLEALQRPLM